MAKQLLFDEHARRKLNKGVSALAGVTRVTLGPAGRNVMIDSGFGAPKVTKDGATASKEIELLDPFENMGARMVNEVANKVNDDVGDGTTTATVLAGAIFSEGMKNVASGADPMAVKRGIDRAVEAVVANLAQQAKPVKGRDKLEQVATIASNNDGEVGKLIADAFEKVGAEGVVTAEEAKALETTLEFTGGMQFDKGYLSPYFITNTQTLTVEFEDAYILFFEKKISVLKDMVPLLEKVLSTARPLLIVAEDVDGEALTALVVNKLRGALNICAVKAPGFGDRRKAMLEDMAAVTGGQLISEDLGVKLENVPIEALGQAKSISIDNDTTTLIDGAGKKAGVKARMDQIRHQIEVSTSDYDKEKLQERLAKLAGGVAIVKVGGASEAEMKERKDRVEDALNATRAASAEGIVSGGGTAYLRALEAVEMARGKARGDEKVGVEIVAKALEAPTRQIATNAGEDGDVVVEEVKAAGGATGFDANTLGMVDMFKTGIIDPAKTVRCALQYAASVAGMMLTTQTMVTELNEDEDEDEAPVEGSVS